MRCVRCQQQIPPGRLEALPHTQTCFSCSREERKVGVMVWDHGSSELVIVESEQAEFAKKMDTGDGRLHRLK